MNSLLHRRAVVGALPGLLVLLWLAACSSDRPSRRGSPSGETAGAAPAPEMETHGTYFAGQIEVEVLVNRDGFGPRDAAAGAPTAGSNSSSSGRGGFGGGFGGLGGGGGGRRGGGRGAGGSSDSGSSTPRGSDDGTPAIRLAVSNQPPVRLHLRLTNHGPAPVEIEVPDFNSDLGNFVVQPPKILLLPNQPIEADPMTSRLGVGAEEIALTVSLRANGKTEKQVLVLRIVKPATPAAALTTAPAASP